MKIIRAFSAPAITDVSLNPLDFKNTCRDGKEKDAKGLVHRKPLSTSNHQLCRPGKKNPSAKKPDKQRIHTYTLTYPNEPEGRLLDAVAWQIESCQLKGFRDFAWALRDGAELELQKIDPFPHFDNTICTITNIHDHLDHDNEATMPCHYKIFLKRSPNLAVYVQLEPYPVQTISAGNEDSTAADRSHRCYCLDVEHEFILMQRLHAYHPSVIPTPYMFREVGPVGKFCLTRFIPSENCVQLARQWITGAGLDVQLGLLHKLAETLARLHSLRIDASTSSSLLHQLQTRVTDPHMILPKPFSFEQEEPDRVLQWIRQMGEQEFSLLKGALLNDFHREDCIIHNDLHLFNVLAVKQEAPLQSLGMSRRHMFDMEQDESEESFSSSSFEEEEWNCSAFFHVSNSSVLHSSHTESFSSNTTTSSSNPLDTSAILPKSMEFHSSSSHWNVSTHETGAIYHRLVIPRWHSSRLGPKGRDLGLVIAWPVACVVWHTYGGSHDDLLLANMSEWITTLWDSYCTASGRLLSGGMKPASQSRLYRNMLAWCGWFLYAELYQKQAYAQVLFPLVGNANAGPDTYQLTLQARVFESIGVIGYQLMHVGFDVSRRNLSLEETKEQFLTIIQHEQHHIRTSSQRATQQQGPFESQKVEL